MGIHRFRPWILAASALAFSACNYPTPAAETPTEAAIATHAEPSAQPSAIPADLTASPAPTAEVELAATAPVQRGLRAAYSDQGNLWVVEQGAAPRQLTDSGGVSEIRISDDGEWIVFVVRDPDEDTAELHGVRFDGSGSRVLIDAASFDSLYPLEIFLHYTLSKLAFIPSSHTLLFNTRGVFEGPGLAKNDDLLAIDVATGRARPLLSRGEGGDFTISQDGTRIAIVRPDSLGFVDASGTDLRPEVVTFTPVITYSEYFFYPVPVWSGPGVVVAVPQEDPFFAAEPGTVWKVDGEPEILARIDGDLFAPQRELPIVSPDGMKVAYLRTAEVAGEQQLVVQRLESGEQILYDHGQLTWRGWAPDSNHMVYSKGTGLDLYLGERGAAPVSLGSGSSLRWVNAGEYLYLRGSPGSWTLTHVDLAGMATPLASPRGDFVAYDFAPGGLVELP